MKKRTYNKLIRDRIPEIIGRDGRNYATEVLGRDDYQRALLEKLVEEAQEALSAEPAKLRVELADLLEVIDAVLSAFEIRKEDVLEIQAQRRTARGGFKKRLKLLWSEG